MITSIINTVVGGIRDYAVNRSVIRKVKTEGEIELLKAKLEAKISKVRREQTATTDWDLLVLQNKATSWKDEFMLLLISYPIIASFIPYTQETVAKGWEYVSQAPEWYVIIYIGIIASVFGLRWLISPITQALSNKFIKGNIINHDINQSK
jgi:hypothetical protein